MTTTERTSLAAADQLRAQLAPLGRAFDQFRRAIVAAWGPSLCGLQLAPLAPVRPSPADVARRRRARRGRRRELRAWSRSARSTPRG